METNTQAVNPDAAEPERKATDHTPVLLSTFRDSTSLNSGLIDRQTAIRCGTYDSLSFIGGSVASRSEMRLCLELPLLEVSYGGQLYRILVRPIDGQAAEVRYTDLVCELVRTKAPGLRCGGVYLEPPLGVPNTPAALIAELLTVTGAAPDDLIANSYSIFHYRLKHKGHYPDSMTPAGYSLRELLMMSNSAGESWRSLYETPPLTSTEKWTLFLSELDKKNPRLPSYVVSSMAVKEFGEVGALAMREALSLRFAPALSSVTPMGYTSFLTAFPVPSYVKKWKRDVFLDTWWF